MTRIRTRIAHSWNAFNSEERKRPYFTPGESWSSSGANPSQPRLRVIYDRSIISSIYTRLSIDVASIAVRHVRLDENDRYLEEVVSGLNECLSTEANVDQTPMALLQDIAFTLFDSGCAAVVPIETSVSPETHGSFDIKNLRVGEVLTWHPQHVRVRVYNEKRGRREEITLAKKSVALIYNPFYPVMNEQNSTLQRLIQKLNQLDSADELAASGKMDVIIQVPYQIKSETKRNHAERRRKDIEFQLKESKYGVAYADGSEKITQLNRPAENNLLKGVEYLTAMLYGQLGLTEEIMNGTADEKTMLNYRDRTLEPIMSAIVQEFRRKFLTKTARTQKQSVDFFLDPFKLVPLENMAAIADKFTRNEILTSNEIRQIVGMKPSKETKADRLRNSNMPVDDTEVDPEDSEESSTTKTVRKTVDSN